MKKILTLFIALILVAGIVSVAKSTNHDIDSGSCSIGQPMERHIVQSSDGTIVVIYWKSATGYKFIARKSTDSGKTDSWVKLEDGTSGYTVIDSTTTKIYYYSIDIDDNDNIYVTYECNNDIFFKKLTAQAGTWTTWTLGDRQTVDGTNDNAYPTITYQESTGRVWVAYGQDDNSSSAWLRAMYSDDDFVSDVHITTVTTGGSSDSSYIPALVLRNDSPYIVYYNSNESDLDYAIWYSTSNSWGSGGTIYASYADIYSDFSVTLINETVHVVFFDDPGELFHTYSSNGTSWSPPETVSTSPYENDGDYEDKRCSLTTDWDTDNEELWVYASIYDRDTSSSFDKSEISYKKWNGSSWSGNWTDLNCDEGYNKSPSTPFVSRGRIPVAWYYDEDGPGGGGDLNLKFNFDRVTLDVTSPGTIDDLSGTCPTGDVILTWSTPEDDDGGSGTLPEMSGYRLDYSSVTKSWDKDDYEVWIPTNGVTPGTGVSHTVASLQEGTSWYFCIWTRDEVPNWSGDSNLATVWIPPSSQPQTYNWDGGGDGVSWDDTDNWDVGGSYPDDANDKAIIDLGFESIDTGEVLAIGQLELGSEYSGTLTLGGNFTLDSSGPQNGNLTISNASATLDLIGYNLTIPGTFSNNGTLKLQGGQTLNFTNDTNSGTVEYTGDGDAAVDTYNLLDSGTTDYYNLTINSTDGATDTFRPDTTNLTVAYDFILSSGTFTTNDGTTDRNLSVTGNVDIVGTFTANNSTITVSGNWDSSAGTFNYGTSTVTFDNASSTSTLTGSTTFYVLISTTTGKNVKVSSDTVIGVTNHLNFENITLRSTLDGATWYLNLSGTQDVSGVDVQDSNASGSTDTIIAFTSTDSGNNTKWDFGPPEAITDLTGECDSQTGDVTLYWSTPGDDYNWQNTLVDPSKYRIDYSSYSIAWSTSTFDVDIPTHSVAPHTPVSHTVASLQEGTSWYFCIWTQDEVPLWSGLSNGATVWIPAPSQPQTYNWDGGGAPGDWDDTDNWDVGGSYPDDANDKAVINTGFESINTGEVLNIGELELGSEYSGTLTLGGNLTLDDSEGWNGNLTIDAGTLDVSGSNHQINIDGNWSNSGTFTAQSGTVTFYATASKTLSGTMTGTSAFYNLYFDNASGTWTLNDNLEVTNVLNINAGELDASNKTIELVGSGTPFLVSGTFTPSNSTVQYTSPNDTNITAANYYHLDLIDPPLEIRNQKPVTSNQKELLQNLEKLKIKEIEPDKFSFKSLSGDLIEIGEERHSPPQPYLKVNRWDGEVSLKVDIPYAIDGQKSLTNNRLRWVNHRYDVDFYPKFPQEIIETIQGKDHIFRINDEGGVEFDLTLKEKPESNVFTFPIEAQGLKFYYQPPLHPEHPTWADSDGDGKADSFRPENVVGSYAVYHESKSGDYTKLGGKNYKAGIAFHIYRPKIYDSNGNWIWGELNISEEKGILTVTIDQNWLDNAVYPVVIDPNFGYETKGSSYSSIISAGSGSYDYFTYRQMSREVYTRGDSLADSIRVWIYNNTGGTRGADTTIYTHDSTDDKPDAKVGQTSSESIPNKFNNWQTFTFSTKPSLSNQTYWLGVRGITSVTETGYAYAFYNTAQTGYRRHGVGYANSQTTWPSPYTTTVGYYDDQRLSIYCTYTAAVTVPTVTTQAASSVEATTATGNGNITATGGENCDIRGIVWDLASHGDPGNVAPGASGYANNVAQSDGFGTGAFTRSLTSLPTGDTIYARAYAHNSAGYAYGAEVNFLTKPAAPTNVDATDGAHTDKVTITWTKSTGATGYKVYEGTNLLDTLGDVATYDDTAAAAPTITPGTATASDGASMAHVALRLFGQSANNGASRTYKVRATNATGDSTDSSTDTGYRGPGSLTYQWQRSSADSADDYSDIDGATTASYNDTGAPEDGSGRYYRCVENATGADPATSTADRGYRATVAPPSIKFKGGIHFR